MDKNNPITSDIYTSLDSTSNDKINNLENTREDENEQTNEHQQPPNLENSEEVFKGFFT